MRMNDRLKAASYAAAIAIAADGIKPAGAVLTQHGEMCFANEARFNEAYFQQPLTTYAVGWRDPGDIEGTLEFLAPGVQVPHKFQYAEFVNADEFLSDTDDDRAIGANFKAVEYTSKKTNAQVENRGLTMRVDLDNVADTPGWELDYTAKLLRRCMRNELRRALTLGSAACTNTAKTWDTTAGKDPDKDVESELITAADLTGIRPNRILYGETAFDKRRLSFRAQNNAGGYASAGLLAEEVGGYLGAEVRVSRERYASSATARTQIVNNLVLMVYGQPGVGTEDASSLKRFWAPCEGGQRWRVFREQKGPKIVEITVEYYSLIKVTSTLGMRQFTIS